MEEVFKGIDVGTFSALKKLTKQSFPYAGGFIALEVFTAKGRETPVPEVVEALKSIQELQPSTRPAWVAIVFGGWDEDPRPVPAIPECQAWCRRFVTVVEPSVLGIIMWEQDAMSHPIAADAGFGIFKLLVTAGYGVADIRSDADGSINAPASAIGPDENGVWPVTYRLTNEGWAIAEAALKAKQRSGFIPR